MAAGCTIAEEDFATFDLGLRAVAASGLDADLLLRRLATDGPLDAQWYTTDVAQLLDQSVWGPGFEAPLFQDDVEVISQRLVGERHLKLSLRVQGQVRDGIWFGRAEPLQDRSRLAYRLSLDEYQGRQRVQMVIEGAQEPD